MKDQKFIIKINSMNKEGVKNNPINNSPEEKKNHEPVTEGAEVNLGGGGDTQEVDKRGGVETESQLSTGQAGDNAGFSFDRPTVEESERGDIAAKFRRRIEEEEKKDEYQAIQPQLRTNYWWTVGLIIIITICLGIIVYLLVTRGTGQQLVDTSNQVLAFNEEKSRFDQSLVDAVNKSIEAAGSYNEGEYAEANDLAKDAERGFSTTLDYLYDLQMIDMGEKYQFLDKYFIYLEEVVVAGQEMSDSLAYSARSADRGQGAEAKKSLNDYEGFRKDFSDAAEKIKLVIRDNSSLFAQ